jgi:acetylornithine deacetylase/succinyl-diaminopimelate desuccinylase-like protein
MASWEPLLDHLAEQARENGTPQIAATARWLATTLRDAGVSTELVTYVAEPWALRLAGVIALAGTLVYWWSMRRGRRGLAALLAVGLPVVLLLELDHHANPFGWIGAAPQEHVVGRIAAESPARRLLFAAHFDTKTDVLDHVERAPLELLGVPAALLMVLGVLLPRVGPWAARLGVVYGAALFTSLSAGAFVPARSPGALDDGAACAVLVRLAERLAAEPPARTAVEVLFLSAEEVGVQGSWEYARRRFANPPDLPTYVVNLDPIGAGSELMLLGRENFSLRRFAPDPALVRVLDEVHRAVRGVPLPRSWYGGGTDARSFLAHRIPAATLMSVPPEGIFVRDLHSAHDSRARVDRTALDATLDYLLAVVRAVDAGALERS